MACGTFFWQELLTQASSLLQSTSGGAPLNIVDFLPQQTPNPALPTVLNNPALGGLPLLLFSRVRSEFCSLAAALLQCLVISFCSAPMLAM